MLVHIIQANEQTAHLSQVFIEAMVYIFIKVGNSDIESSLGNKKRILPKLIVHSVHFHL